MVLGSVAAAGLKLHTDKYYFLWREVEFLGHKLGCEGIGMPEEKISIINSLAAIDVYRHQLCFSK